MRETVAIGEFEDDFETEKERSLCHFLQFLLILLIGIAICASTVVLAVMVVFLSRQKKTKTYHSGNRWWFQFDCYRFTMVTKH